MKIIPFSLFLLFLLTGCSTVDTIEQKSTSSTAISTQSTTTEDTTVEFTFDKSKQLFTITNNTTDLVTIHTSETEFFKQEGNSWLSEGGTKGLLAMSFNLLPGETSDYEHHPTFHSGTLKAVFYYSIEQKEYSKEIIFDYPS